MNKIPSKKKAIKKINIRHNKNFSDFIGSGRKFQFRKANKTFGNNIFEFETSICKEFSNLILAHEGKEISVSIFYEMNKAKNQFNITGEYYSIADDGRTLKIDSNLIGEFDFKMLQAIAYTIFQDCINVSILIDNEFPV